MMKGVESHIWQESKVFRQISKVLDKVELEEIGAELEAEKQDYQKYQ